MLHAPIRSLAVLIVVAAGALAVAAGGAAAQTAGGAAPAAQHAQIGAFGLDLSGGDASVKPGDDFERYANGHWDDTAQIPAGSGLLGLVRHTARALAAAAARDPRSSAGRCRRGQQPPQASRLLSRVPRYRGDRASRARARRSRCSMRSPPRAAARTSPASWAVRSCGSARRSTFGMQPDDKDPDHYMVTIRQSGLGMPDRDYYLKDEPVYKELRAKYAAHIERLLKLAGDADAAQEAQSILELETQIATRALAARQAPRARPHLQPAHARGSAGVRSGPAMAGAARRGRARGAAALRGARVGCGTGARCAVREGAAAALADLSQLPLPGGQCGRAAAGLRRRGVRLLWPRAARHAGAAAALEACRGRCERRARGGGGRAVRAALLPAVLEARRCSRWSRTCAPPTASASPGCRG